ncbi:efflux RND transporter periplasmic adaptor subunit [Ningiella sp. W23]|uniref:efflux RND transporter periplasmic adaptor subunit n=1 Tax=Ningiella sp. W23 TaxID=3023715 RepID=UPI00375639A5
MPNDSAAAPIKHGNNGKLLLTLITVVSFILLIILMSVSGSGSSQAYTQSDLMVVENMTVEVMPIKMQSQFTRKRIVYGQIESAKQSDVGFELAGVLAKRLVAEGDSVRQGQALAMLDLARLDARENELIASLDRARADATLAELSAKRTQELVDAKLEPQQRLDEAQAALNAATALVNEVQARLQSLQVEKEKSTIIAPFDGQVVAELADEGTVLNTGQAVFSVLATDSLEARFGLPENIAFGVELGEQYRLTLGGLEFPASVKSISKQRNLATRTIDTVFALSRNTLAPAELEALVSGDLVSISVPIEVDKRGAWIPLDALSSGVRGLWTVFVYDQSSQSIASRTVAVEHIEAEKAFVSGAIQDEDLIVANGSHRLTPGQTVTQVREVKNTVTNTMVDVSGSLHTQKQGRDGALSSYESADSASAHRN